MKVKMILSFLLVVVSIVVINSVFAFMIGDPFQRLWLSAAIGMLVGMGLGYVVSANLMKGLSSLSAVAREVSSGDLTKEIDTSGDEEVAELAVAFKTMVRELKGIVGLVQQGALSLNSSAKNLSGSAQQMSASAEEIASATEHIAKGAEVQVEGVTKAAARIKESARSMEEIAGKAGKVAQASSAAADKAQRGGEVAATALEKMRQVFEQMEGSTEMVHGFGERTQEVGKIVEVITGISQQTNLLALNATIEAARAGEYGRGFAVVADEVRKLSEKTHKSAEEITALISQIGDESVKVVGSMEAGTAVIREGREVIDTIRASLEGIIGETVMTAEGVREISSLAESQSRGTGEIVETTNEIFRIAEDNAAATEEASAATEELTSSMEEMAGSAQGISTLAGDLQKLVTKFRVEDTRRM
jgi:methyl-accepting chemotaxis protein